MLFGSVCINTCSLKPMFHVKRITLIKYIIALYDFVKCCGICLKMKQNFFFQDLRFIFRVNIKFQVHRMCKWHCPLNAWLAMCPDEAGPVLPMGKNKIKSSSFKAMVLAHKAMIEGSWTQVLGFVYGAWIVSRDRLVYWHLGDNIAQIGGGCGPESDF